MDYFDRLVEFELRRMLDPVVASRVPSRRRGAKGNDAPFLVVGRSTIELAPETIAVGDPAAVTLPQPFALVR
jgi:hypothetical protein